MNEKSNNLNEAKHDECCGGEQAVRQPVEVCLFSYKLLSVSEMFFSNPELWSFFSNTRLNKIAAYPPEIANSLEPDRRLYALEQSMAAELAVCAAMKKCGRGFKPPNYGCKANAQPTISGGFVSISHTLGYAVCAIAKQPTGADVERRRAFGNAVKKRILSENETELLKNAPDLNEALLQIWTAKESFLKMTGEGIAGGMQNLELTPIGRNPSGVFTVNRFADGTAGYISTIRIEDDGSAGAEAYLSVCTAEKTLLNITHFDSIEKILTYLKD